MQFFIFCLGIALAEEVPLDAVTPAVASAEEDALIGANVRKTDIALEPSSNDGADKAALTIGGLRIDGESIGRSLVRLIGNLSDEVLDPNTAWDDAASFNDIVRHLPPHYWIAANLVSNAPPYTHRKAEIIPAEAREALLSGIPENITLLRNVRVPKVEFVAPDEAAREANRMGLIHRIEDLDAFAELLAPVLQRNSAAQDNTTLPRPANRSISLIRSFAAGLPARSRALNRAMADSADLAKADSDALSGLVGVLQRLVRSTPAAAEVASANAANDLDEAVVDMLNHLKEHSHVKYAVQRLSNVTSERGENILRDMARIQALTMRMTADALLSAADELEDIAEATSAGNDSNRMNALEPRVASEFESMRTTQSFGGPIEISDAPEILREEQRMLGLLIPIVFPFMQRQLNILRAIPRRLGIFGRERGALYGLFQAFAGRPLIPTFGALTDNSILMPGMEAKNMESDDKKIEGAAVQQPAINSRREISKNPIFLGLPVPNILYSQVSERWEGLGNLTESAIWSVQGVTAEALAPVEESRTAFLTARDLWMSERLHRQNESLSGLKGLVDTIGDEVDEQRAELDSMLNRAILPLNRTVGVLGRIQSTLIHRGSQNSLLLMCLLNPECCDKPELCAPK